MVFRSYEVEQVGTTARAGAGGSDVSDVVCGGCAPALEVRVYQPDGRGTPDWSADVHGNGIDCTSDWSSTDCTNTLTAGDYDLDVSAGCSRWIEHVRIHATNPAPHAFCDCGYIPVVVELRETARDCDQDAGDDDAGGSEDAGS